MDDIEQTLRLSPEELREWWMALTTKERIEFLPDVGRDDAEDLFRALTAHDQADLLMRLPQGERRSYLRQLGPAATADVIQEAPEEDRAGLIGLLDEETRREVAGLLAYEEDDAGGLMSPRFARVRPDVTTDEALAYLRRQARKHIRSAHYVYVLDAQQRLLGVTSYRELIEAPGDKHVRDVMVTDPVSVPEEMDQEEVSRVFAQADLVAIPVLDREGRMKGVVTVHDIVDVVQEEATEDIQKLGGTEALDAPYVTVGLGGMVRKRIGWLAILFFGGLLTASAMESFADEIARTVVLAMFVPLIISSGGNSGSQATTLVIRAMALGEVRLRDWFRVVRREIGIGLALGVILAALGFLRIVVVHAVSPVYGQQHLLLAITIAGSLVTVVVFGTLVGSMLPFLLRRFGFDPASASAPLVATLVDVCGVVIYFGFASMALGGGAG